MNDEDLLYCYYSDLPSPLAYITEYEQKENANNSAEALDRSKIMQTQNEKTCKPKMIS